MNNEQLNNQIQNDLKVIQELANKKAAMQAAPQPTSNLGGLIKQFTDSANAMIDYINQNCTSDLALTELYNRHIEVLSYLILQYKQERLRK
jgi:hypothetical protein